MIDAEVQRRLRERFYPQADHDVYAPIHEALDRHIIPGTAVLDAGCGHGSPVLPRRRDRIWRLVGVDIAPAEGAQILDHFVMADLARLPLKDNSFDVVFSWNVVEHLPVPGAAFAEFGRVLRDDGVLIVKTPSVVSPIMLASKLSPSFIHKNFKSRLLGFHEHDVHPTLYRCNTVGRLHRELTAAGFRRELLTRFDQTYGYLAFSRITYVLGLLYSRSLKSLPLAESLMAAIFGVYRKAKTEARNREKDARTARS